ncbi:hypothetical protein D3C76_1832500 [compost metagenome]
MGVDVTQLEVVPQGVGPGGEVGFIRGVHIGGVEIHDHPVFRIGFLPVPGQCKTVAGAV